MPCIVNHKIFHHVNLQEDHEYNFYHDHDLNILDAKEFELAKHLVEGLSEGVNRAKNEHEEKSWNIEHAIESQ